MAASLAALGTFVTGGAATGAAATAAGMQAVALAASAAGTIATVSASKKAAKSLKIPEKPEPNLADTSAIDEQRKKRAQSGQQGYSGTILTGGLGVPNSGSSSQKTLLGL